MLSLRDFESMTIMIILNFYQRVTVCLVYFYGYSSSAISLFKLCYRNFFNYWHLIFFTELNKNSSLK